MFTNTIYDYAKVMYMPIIADTSQLTNYEILSLSYTLHLLASLADEYTSHLLLSWLFIAVTCDRFG